MTEARRNRASASSVHEKRMEDKPAVNRKSAAYVKKAKEPASGKTLPEAVETPKKAPKPKYEIRRRKDRKQVRAAKKTYVMNRRPKDEGKPKKRHTLAYVLAALILLAGGACTAFYFIAQVDTITVDGNVRFSDSDIINLSGLYTGKNILTYDLAEARDGIESNPYIDCIGVSRILPDTIGITVREREEFAAIVGSGGMNSIIDREGFVLDVGRRGDTEGLISVYGLGSMGLTTGTSIVSDKSKLRPYTLIELFKAIGERTDRISYIDVSNSASVKIGTREGVTVMFGDSIDVAQKTEYMFRAIAKADSSKLSGTVIYINSNGTADIAYPTPLPSEPADTEAPLETGEPGESGEPAETDEPSGTEAP